MIDSCSFILVLLINPGLDYEVTNLRKATPFESDLLLLMTQLHSVLCNSMGSILVISETRPIFLKFSAGGV